MRVLMTMEVGVGIGDAIASLPMINYFRFHDWKIRLICRPHILPVYKLLPRDTFEVLCTLNNQERFYTPDFDRFVSGQYWLRTGVVKNFGMPVSDWICTMARIPKQPLAYVELPKIELYKAQQFLNRLPDKPNLLYQSNVSFWNKMLEPEKWARVIEEAKEHFNVIQIGAKQPIKHTIDLTGKTTLHESMALAYEADLLLGGDSWLNHWSPYTNTEGVFVWTSTSPADFGYDRNRNIYTNCPCSPCGRPERWNYDYEYPNGKRSECGWVCKDKKCETIIGVDDILEQIYI